MSAAELEMTVHHAEVVAATDLSAGMRRVVFGGSGLDGYRSTGVGDEYIRLLFPVDPAGRPDLPGVVDGNLDYGSIDTDQLRTYTVRDWDDDARRLTVDFVVHEGGVAATWARQAAPGQVIGLNSPTALYSPPAGLEWQVLVADYAGLPAAVRLVETTPGVRTRLVLEVPDASYELAVPERPDLEVVWIHGGNGHAPSRLEEVVRSLPRPEGVGYVWVAGESKVLRGVRKYLRQELRLPAAAYKTVGYWIEDAERWRERYDALGDDIRAALDAIWEQEGSDEELEDRYEARLAELGL
ncbi:siderophore-interacting protein [Pimelobacter simplex]|uniref:siderophore-interacting protein n=1 Tax=Nocardioides simplex TaxID=2045 RepID=UPI00214F90E0|nr:siderophore-interacting protein [Pimelobacter simplex]UUW89183.1 siderophore-interacting protein [Pimelobacter simplex]UUW98687.1 siderophore-interacting protein [Pimelobacter simplex]